MNDFDITKYDETIQKAIKSFEESLREEQHKHQMEQHHLKTALQGIQHNLRNLRDIITIGSTVDSK